MSVTLHQIAKEIAIQRRDNGDVHLPEYLLYGRDAVAEFNLRGFIPVRSIALDIDRTTNSAKLPEDYLKYTQVGVCICDRIIELDYDATLCVREPKDDFCVREQCVSLKEEDSIEYEIDVTTEAPIWFTYTSDPKFPNAQRILVAHNINGIVCSYTIPVEETPNSGKFNITELGGCSTTGTNQTYYEPEGGEGSSGATESQSSGCGCGGSTITSSCSNPESHLICDCETLCNGGTPDHYQYYYHWDNISYNGHYIEPLVAFPAYQSRGFFKIQNGRIYLNSVCGKYADKVILKYKSTNNKDCGVTEFPDILKHAIKAYVLWQIELNAYRPNQASVRMRWDEFKRQKDFIRDNEILQGVADMLKVQMSHTFVANLGR